jgi:hypothetical protein
MPGGVRALAAYLLGMRSVSGVSQRQQTDHLGLVLAPRPHTTLRCLTLTTPPSLSTPDSPQTCPLRAAYERSPLSTAATLPNAGYSLNRSPAHETGTVDPPGVGTWARHWARDMRHVLH